MPQPPLNAIVTDKIDLNEEHFILRFRLKEGVFPKFEPGQYIAIGLPGPEKMIQRTYSIASAPKHAEELELYIIEVKDGSLTPKLNDLKKGDEIWAAPRIVGKFTLDGLTPEAHVLLVSTGTGLAPYMSMIRERWKDQCNQPVAVLHGVRHSWDLGYRDELEALAKKHKLFEYLPTVSRPQQEKTPFDGRCGYVQDIWTKRELNTVWNTELTSKNTHVFLCGNPNMIDKFAEILTKESFTEHTPRTPGQIHVERYW